MDGIIFKPPLDELYHHGIKGQKWGVRNGPPYPLSSKVSTGKRLKSSIGKSGVKKKITKSEAVKVIKDSDKIGMDPFTVAVLATYVAVPLATMALMAIQNNTMSKKEKMEFLKARERNKKIDELRSGTKIDENRFSIEEKSECIYRRRYGSCEL